MKRYLIQTQDIRPRAEKVSRRTLIEACLSEVERGDAITSIYCKRLMETIAEIDPTVADKFDIPRNRYHGNGARFFR